MAILVVWLKIPDAELDGGALHRPSQYADRAGNEIRRQFAELIDEAVRQGRRPSEIVGSWLEGGKRVHSEDGRTSVGLCADAPTIVWEAEGKKDA